jgi:CspA family cold shock protein
MTRNQLLAGIGLSITVALGLVTAFSMLGRVRAVNVTVLFFSGLGAGVSVKVLIDTVRRAAPRPGLARVKPTVAAPEPRRRRPRGNERRGKRPGRKKQVRLQGKVKWFDDTKGFGFITPDDGKEDCFVHRSAIQGGRSLAEGTRVEFHIVNDEKGRRAAADVAGI